jgi:hypothetical protein
MMSLPRRAGIKRKVLKGPRKVNAKALPVRPFAITFAPSAFKLI